MEKNALQLLADYGNDGGSSEEDVPGPKVSTKRSFKENDFPKKLPVPEFMKTNEAPTWEDNPSEHQGRIRSFKHERGNWPTFVYIPCEPHTGITSLQESIKNCIPDVSLQQVEELHLSLTKTVVLKYHWIQSFMNSIKERVYRYRRFFLTFGNLKVYCNEEKTRTFIGLEVTSAQDTLRCLIKELDISLSDFQLSPFYKDPSFHVSILWCLGDMQSKLDSYLPHLNLMLNKVVTEHSNENWYITVNYLFCKTGTTFMLSGRNDSERVQRRHYPQLANASVVSFSKQIAHQRIFLLKKDKLKEKRHIRGRAHISHFDPQCN